MTLHTDSAHTSNARTDSARTDKAKRERLVTYDKNICPQCSAWLLAPDWSEHLNERCVRHSWSCDACGYGFETSVFFAPLKTSLA